MLLGLSMLMSALRDAGVRAQEHACQMPVGLDTEWRLPRVECSTLQIAFERTAFVVDTFCPPGRTSDRYTSSVRRCCGKTAEADKG